MFGREEERKRALRFELLTLSVPSLMVRSSDIMSVYGTLLGHYVSTPSTLLRHSVVLNPYALVTWVSLVNL